MLAIGFKPLLKAMKVKHMRLTTRSLIITSNYFLQIKSIRVTHATHVQDKLVNISPGPQFEQAISKIRLGLKARTCCSSSLSRI